MSEYIRLSIDTKKNRIRFHKKMLHLLGDPPYLQLLINPETMIVAVKALTHSLSGDQSHKVSRYDLLSDNSIEIYSRYLVSKIVETLDIDIVPFTVCLDGKLLKKEHAALFDLHQLLGKEQKNEKVEDRPGV